MIQEEKCKKEGKGVRGFLLLSRERREREGEEEGKRNLRAQLEPDKVTNVVEDSFSFFDCRPVNQT